MTEENENKSNMVTLQSTRFGELSVPADTIIRFPSGLIGFPRAQGFIMIDHKPPFSWLHSVDDPALAFVVVDGWELTQGFELKAPYGDKEIDLKADDEYAILVIVTVRADPKLTTANLKAPLFVNVRNKKGLQMIIDDPRLSTRHPLWTADEDSDQKDK